MQILVVDRTDQLFTALLLSGNRYFRERAYYQANVCRYAQVKAQIEIADG